MTQDREDLGSAYCRKFGIKILVYAEWYDVIHDAIDREKRLKVWTREWKVALIERSNPQWHDLYETLPLGLIPQPSLG
jgi:putative endonuclease